MLEQDEELSTANGISFLPLSPFLSGISLVLFNEEVEFEQMTLSVLPWNSVG